MDELFALDDLRRREYFGLETDWLLPNFEAPVLDCLLLEKLVHHILDFAHLLTGADTRLGQRISHPSAFAHTIRHAVQQAKLRRQVTHILCDLNHEERLRFNSDLLLVMKFEVASHVDLFILPKENLGHRIFVEDYVEHEVGALVAPVGDDGLTDELLTDLLLPLLSRGIFASQVQNAFEAGLSGHELKDRVHHQGASQLALER